MKITAILTALVGTLGVATAASLTDYKPVSRVDTYDKGTISTPVKGTAGGFINYIAWSYALRLSPKAPSGLQTIGTGIRGQTLEGQPAFLPLNENVKCFDMKSIRNACLANTQGTGVAIPVSCTVQFSARSALTGRVFTKPAIYNPPFGSLTEPFNTTTFPSNFKCIDRVDITLISATLPGGGAVVGVALDNFGYTAYVKPAAIEKREAVIVEEPEPATIEEREAAVDEDLSAKKFPRVDKYH